MEVPDPTILRVTVEEADGGATVRVSGEVDVQSADELRGHLVVAGEAHRRLVADLSGVTFMDWAGLGALVSAHRTITEQGGTLVLAGTHGMVRQVITASRLDELLTLAEE
jgi:anti-anti-sigma factor